MPPRLFAFIFLRPPFNLMVCRWESGGSVDVRLPFLSGVRNLYACRREIPIGGIVARDEA